jgi:nitronate monooxygenase
MAKQTIHDLLRRPLVVAPMGGGPSTPELVVAAAEGGAVGFLAAGYKTSAAMASEITAVRARTSEAFGINVFVPGVPASDETSLAQYLDSLAADVEAIDAELGQAVWDDDAFDEKIAVLLRESPPIVSFTFGCPKPEVIAAFRDVGSVVAVTVTSPDEATFAANAGADALCVQGDEAGAHRGSFTNDDRPGRDLGVLALIAEVAKRTDLPQIAAGGIMDSGQVTAVIAAGADAVMCGTAFLRCPESGAHPTYKVALADPRFATTVLTRAFSGRPARGLLNHFARDHADAPGAYPEINNATRPLRARAAAIGDPERMSLWAGVGFAAARDRPAAEIIEHLCAGSRSSTGGRWPR